jgi:hypothetical protein
MGIAPIERWINKDNLINGILNLRGDESISFDKENFEKDITILSENDINNPEALIPRFRSFSKKFYEELLTVPKRRQVILSQREEVSRNLKPGEDIREKLKASILLISACQDWQLAGDGKEHGVFTQALKDVFKNEGGENMNYLQLHQAIWAKIKNQGQSPNYYKIGTPNFAFEVKTCFTI